MEFLRKFFDTSKKDVELINPLVQQYADENNVQNEPLE